MKHVNMVGPDQAQSIEASSRVQHAPRASLSEYRSQNTQHTQSSNPLGPMAVPVGPHRMNGNGQQFQGHMQRPSGGSGFGGFDMPRSPPHDKNTAHVPCKFFRLGKCTYGDACPFEHSVRDGNETVPCKYFARGNCKFGQKCALAHILPDGRRINGPNSGMEAPFGNGGGHGSQHQFSDSMYRPSNIALQRSAAGQQYGYTQEEPMFVSRIHKSFDPIPSGAQVDTAYSSHHSNFGSSPPAELKLAASPQGARALDAPLPASFDANGLSNYARHGPAAASVPTGWLRPSPASPTSPTLSLAFGNLNGLTLGESHNARYLGAGASPPSMLGEGLFARKPLPISSRSRPKMMAASFNPRDIWKSNDEDDSTDTHEEDLVPAELGLLTDEEKVRRFSRTDQDSGTKLSAVGSPTGSKVGSPSTASPSRFGAFFAKRSEGEGPLGAAVGSSPFGHIGSPLRKFSTTVESGELLTLSAAGDSSTYLSSPPRGTISSNDGTLSQQLGRTRLTVKPEVPDIFQARHPGALRTTSNTSITSSGGSSSRMNRAVSSTSVAREKIEEDIFEMEDEDDDDDHAAMARTDTHHSSGSYGSPNIWSIQPAEQPLPNLGAIGGQRRMSSKEFGK